MLTGADTEPIFRILLIEDNPADVRLMREAFAECGFRTELYLFEDGQSAVDAIMEDIENNEWQRWRPDLILLDLHLPKLDGLNVLQIIKTNELTRSVPVIVLSGSSAPGDVHDAYDLKANCYVQKPSDLTSFFRLVKSIQKFWITTASLPNRQ